MTDPVRKTLLVSIRKNNVEDDTYTSKQAGEIYISVDIETAGPYPFEYSMLSIGACTTGETRQTFYVELQPLNDKATPEALEVSHLSLERLAQEGLQPAEAMRQFARWLAEQTPVGQRPVFVAFNAGFDWMFVNAYFHHFLGFNPFGHTALDIKALYMGLFRVQWRETSMRYISKRLMGEHQLSHHALHDAIDQAVIFEKLLTTK